MKKRLVKKVERMALVDKVCELQSYIDEYERYLGDLLIMVLKKAPQSVVEHSVPGDDKMGWIWEKVRDLIEENNELARKLQEKS